MADLSMETQGTIKQLHTSGNRKTQVVVLGCLNFNHSLRAPPFSCLSVKIQVDPPAEGRTAEDERSIVGGGIGGYVITQSQI